MAAVDVTFAFSKQKLVVRRNSLLFDAVVQNLNLYKSTFFCSVDLPSQSEQRSAAEKISFQQPNDGDEEYIPDDDPPIKGNGMSL